MSFCSLEIKHRYRQNAILFKETIIQLKNYILPTPCFWGRGLFPTMHCDRSAKMASDGEDVVPIEDQEERKATAVSFGFTKTISKFKPPSVDALSNKDEKEYLTRIDKHLLQR